MQSLLQMILDSPERHLTNLVRKINACESLEDAAQRVTAQDVNAEAGLSTEESSAGGCNGGLQDGAALPWSSAVADDVSTPDCSPANPSTIQSGSASSTLPGHAVVITASLSADPGPLSNLSPNQRIYLDFLRRSVGRDRYFLNFDAAELILSTLDSATLFYGPLLHAAVGFAAYLHAVDHANGDLSEVMEHYAQSVCLLRETLGSGPLREDAAILTILQLAILDVSQSACHERRLEYEN